METRAETLRSLGVDIRTVLAQNEEKRKKRDDVDEIVNDAIRDGILNRRPVTFEDLFC